MEEASNLPVVTMTKWWDVDPLPGGVLAITRHKLAAQGRQRHSTTSGRFNGKSVLQTPGTTPLGQKNPRLTEAHNTAEPGFWLGGHTAGCKSKWSEL